MSNTRGRCAMRFPVYDATSVRKRIFKTVVWSRVRSWYAFSAPEMRPRPYVHSDPSRPVHFPCPGKWSGIGNWIKTLSTPNLAQVDLI